MQNRANHTFHIPVMGIAFTIDSPLKVARFGINSVISIVEDKLIEMMRRHYYKVAQLEYFAISQHEPDYRARRITDYLNLVNRIVQQQVETIRTTPFAKGSDIVKYFEMLPEGSTAGKLYKQMLQSACDVQRSELQQSLRKFVKAGRIDVNIMTKIDRDNIGKNGSPVPDGSDAVAALRGYANSDLTDSAVIFSAGMNPRLFNYLSGCWQFRMNSKGKFDKKVIVKVSDFRSAFIQGKFLAKKGIWVSEFRIESGLNCGGHAFATDGQLMGPILEEFKIRREELRANLFKIFYDTMREKHGVIISDPPSIDITVQGGIGTYDETKLLLDYYKVESTGWGTPFLLVPEATTVDTETINLLSLAGKDDVVLSNNSPLGVRFHYLKNTTSDKEKYARILKGKPGSPCTEKHLAFNTEFTKEPICTASHKYQKLKIDQLKSLDLPGFQYKNEVKNVLDKECLCIGLSNSAPAVYKLPFVKKLTATTICPGPNIVNFSDVVSLQTMTDHIYGRTNIIKTSDRPHMFISELRLYIDFIKEQIEKAYNVDSKKAVYITSFICSLNSGIDYYQKLSAESVINCGKFNSQLHQCRKDLELIMATLLQS